MNRLYRLLLRLYPAAFREEYGRQMELAFAEQGQPVTQALADLITVAPREHLHIIVQDLRYAFRSIAARPGFAAVALASLALGIGANTAIFGLWYNVTRAPLPLVKQPEQLVMLTNPSAIGAWSGDQGGERLWMSYPEFEWMRDHLEGVSGVMASQSALNEMQVRIDGGDWEKVRGHFVSGGYFDLLGVGPLLGRAFTVQEDRQASPSAVISYDYWMRRFGGRADVLGQTISFRTMPVTVTGVMPQGFIGEVAAQSPEVWIPARMQPELVPRGNLLVDGPVNDGVPIKFMWLHVFARLKPGVTLAQTQARVDALFRTDLERSYGKAVDQHLVVREAARGVSDARPAFSSALTGMLMASAILLLIACANVANLMLARGAVRRSEFAIRIAQGASRGRLIRQMVTESLVLASLGAAAGIGVAYALHRGLVTGMATATSDFALAFRLDSVTLAFTIGAMLVATVLSGAIPAWRVTRVDANESLKDHSRGATFSTRKMRFGRMLVGAQLALALPLLSVAGLLVRTVQNAAKVDLGYRSEGLVQVRIDALDAGYDGAREDALRERLRGEILRIPGVRSVAFSDNGLFTGGRSVHTVKVEGFEARNAEDRESRLEVVAPSYFETLGIRPLSGRLLQETDRAGAPLVIVIDEAFRKRFFAGTEPLGKRVTTGRGKNQRILEIVGVVPSFATANDLVNKTPPARYFLAAGQRGPDGVGLNFILRSATGAPVFPAIRGVVAAADSSLPVEMKTLEDSLLQLTALERTLSQLAVAFGSVALLLAAIGLYGVLAYGVAQRRGEIGIRIALGAERGRVVGLILRESAAVVLGGLIVGLWPAYTVSQLVRTQFAQFAPQDPSTVAAAATVLLIVAFAAAYLPARRASRLDPMTALRQ